MHKGIGIGLVGLLGTLWAGPAHAQDGCSDILKSGVFDTVDMGSRSEYQEIIISRFLASDYASSRKSGSGIGGKSIGEMVMGNAYTEAQYNQKKSQLQQSYTKTLTQIEEWNLATRTANPAIVGAWEKCMDGRNGLLARFETQPGDGRNITLVLSVKGAMGTNQVKISENTRIPSFASLASNAQYKQCLKKGAVIRATAPCRVALIVPSASPLKLIISTRQGDSEAYIGKRMRWSFVQKPFSFESTAHVEANESRWEAAAAKVSAADVAEGYTLNSKSIAVTGPVMSYGSGDGRCHHYTHVPVATQIDYRYLLQATDNMDTGCKIMISATLEKGGFVIDE
jgi:hypothetical protein